MAESPGLNDGDLLRRSAGGDQEAFTALYRRFQGPVYRFALHMSGNGTVAEEVTQEVFMALIRGGSQVDISRGPLIAWLLGVARNQVLKYVERDSRYQPLECSDEGASDPAVRENQLEALTRNEALGKLRQAVLALPSRYREVVVLCELQEMNYEDAGRVLDCATGTIRSRLHRARALLAGRLGAEAKCPA
jgi:RNA polymerase sigma-70 factor (ECF subfamily)